METLTVMSPYLPDDERAQRLNALRLGQIELTELKKKTLLAAKSLTQEGKKVTVRAMYQVLSGEVGQRQIAYTLKNLRQVGLLAVATEIEDVATSEQD